MLMIIDQRVGDEGELQRYLRQPLALVERRWDATNVEQAVPLIYAAAPDYFNLLFGSQIGALTELIFWSRSATSEYSITRATGLMRPDGELAGIVIALGGKDRQQCQKANIQALLKSRDFHERWGQIGYDALRDPLPSVPADAYYIRILSVAPKWQRHGLGQWLMQIALENGRCACYERFRVDVREDNLPARRFYERFGFKISARALNPITPCAMLALCAP
jgi:ribosomal protein S18 acetylase RimI-like enzyme